MRRDAADLLADHLTLAGVEPGPDRDPSGRTALTMAEAHRMAGRTVEAGEEPIAGRVNFPTAPTANKKQRRSARWAQGERSLPIQLSDILGERIFEIEAVDATGNRTQRGSFQR